MTCRGKRVHLIGTPGFNDSTRKDTDVLKDIAVWLAKAYDEDTRLNGLVYMHRIHEARMKGTDMSHLRMFKSLTGLENMEFVVLTTSYWDVTPDATGESREEKLKTRETFWKAMIDVGAKVMRFKNDRVSALDIIGHIVEMDMKKYLHIQKEMSEQKKTLVQTEAGLELNSEINKHVEESKKRWDDEQEKINKGLREGKQKAVQEALEAQKELKEKRKKLEAKQKSMDVTSLQLIKDKDEEIKKAREEMEGLGLERERTGEEHKRQLAEKDKERVKSVEETNRGWEEGLSRVEAYLEGAAAIKQQEQQQRPSESTEEVIRRVLREQEPKPPSYSQVSLPQYQNYP